MILKARHSFKATLKLKDPQIYFISCGRQQLYNLPLTTTTQHQHSSRTTQVHLLDLPFHQLHPHHIATAEYFTDTTNQHHHYPQIQPARSFHQADWEVLRLPFKLLQGETFKLQFPLLSYYFSPPNF